MKKARSAVIWIEINEVIVLAEIIISIVKRSWQGFCEARCKVLTSVYLIVQKFLFLRYPEVPVVLGREDGYEGTLVASDGREMDPGRQTW